MKKTLLLTTLVALLFSFGAQAQSIPVVKSLPKIDFGVMLGANFEQLNGNSWKQAYKPGIVGGLFLGLRKNKLGVQLEALVNTAQYNTKDITFANGTTQVGQKINATYIDIPLLFQYKVIPFLWLQVGPEYSSLLSSTKIDNTDVFKSGAAAAIIGAELKLPVKLNIGIRYVLGLSDLNKGASTTGVSEAWQRRTIQLHVGFRIF